MWVGKRYFDLFFSILGIIFLSPLFFVLMVWIKTDSKGRIFYRQQRVGKNGKLFYIHKFRTMIEDAENRGLPLTVGVDARITNSGRFIRKFKLDEFAQLIDVVLGSMSIVGPRPEVPKYVEFYSQDMRQKVLSVRPGITDWASILYKDENDLLSKSSNPEHTYTTEVLPKKLEYCVRYVENASVFEDLKIIFMTIYKIFFNR